MTSISELTSEAAIERHRESWQELWEDTPGASFAQHIDWYLAWCRENSQRVRPRVLLAGMAGKSVGLLPLVERRDDSTRGQVRLEFASVGWSTFCGPLGRNPAATWLLAMRWLQNQPRHVDQIVLHNLDGNGTDRGRAMNAMRVCSMKAQQLPGGKVPLIETSGSQAAFDATRPAEMQNDLAAAERTLARSGRVQFVRFRSDSHSSGQPGTGRKLLEHCHRLRRLSSGAIVGPMNSAPLASGRRLTDGFLEKTHRAAVAAGAADICLLHLSGDPVAAVYSHHVAGRLEGVYCGMHPEAPPEAMLVLFDRLVRDSFCRGDQSLVPPAGLIAPWQGWQTRTLSRRCISHQASGLLKTGFNRLVRLFHRPAKAAVSRPALPDTAGPITGLPAFQPQGEPQDLRDTTPEPVACLTAPRVDIAAETALEQPAARPQLRIARFPE